MRKETIVAVKAPPGTSLEVPDPDEVPVALTAYATPAVLPRSLGNGMAREAVSDIS